MNTYEIRSIFIESEKHSVKNSVLSIENEDFQFYFESSAQDQTMIKYILEGVLGRRVTVFAEDNQGIRITLIGCVFSPSFTFNDMIRQEEFLHYKALIIERIFIGDYVNSSSIYKSLSVQIRFDDKSVRDGLNRNNKLTMNRIINESFQIEFDKFSYDISLKV